MKLSRFIAIGAASMALLSFVEQAPAQSREDVRRSMEARRGGPIVSEPPTATVNFRGGTLGQFVDALRDAMPAEHANIIVQPAASELAMPAAKLSNVTAITALFAVEQLLVGPEMVIDVSVSIEGGSPVITVRADRVQQLQRRTGPQRMSANDESDLQVFSLGELTKVPLTIDPALPGVALSPDAIIDAVEIAVDSTSAEDEAPSIRFHESTNLLFVTGSRQTLIAVNGVLAALNRELEVARSHASQAMNDPVFDELEAVENTIVQLESRVRLARAAVERAETADAKNSLQASATEFEAQLKSAISRRDRLAQRASTLRGQAQDHLADELEQLRIEREMLGVELNLAVRRLELLENKREEVRKLMDEGFETAGSVADADMGVLEGRASVKRIELRMMSIESRMKRVADERDAAKERRGR